MMNALIIDDEPLNVTVLQNMLSKYHPQVKVAGTAMNGREGLTLIRKTNPDLLFLDIEMPEMSGIEMLEQLHSFPFAVIFVTGYNKYAVQAIKLSALDFIIKPVQVGELAAAIAKAEQKIREKKWSNQLKQLLESYKNPQAVKRIALVSKYAIDMVTLSSIIRCQSDNVYSDFYLQGGEKITVSKPLTEYEDELLEFGFIRCHQSHIVNSLHVRKLMNKDASCSLLLTDQSTVPVARNRKEAIWQFLLAKDGPGFLG